MLSPSRSSVTSRFRGSRCRMANYGTSLSPKGRSGLPLRGMQALECNSILHERPCHQKWPIEVMQLESLGTLAQSVLVLPWFRSSWYAFTPLTAQSIMCGPALCAPCVYIVRCMLRKRGNTLFLLRSEFASPALRSSAKSAKAPSNLRMRTIHKYPLSHGNYQSSFYVYGLGGCPTRLPWLCRPCLKGLLNPVSGTSAPPSPDP